MALSWSARRQTLYYGVAGVFLVVFLGLSWNVFLSRTPTCFDGVKNNNETGVDCGGSCAQICKEAAKAPLVKWARSFRTNDNTYTAAAYVENLNPGAGARKARYSFQLFDADNVLVVERSGSIDLPPMNLIPIVETNVNVGTRSVVRTLFAFADEPVWDTITEPALELRLSNQNLSEDGSRLSATLTNNSVRDAQKVIVVAVLFDSNGVARAASKTTLNVARKSSQPIVFTWPSGTPSIVRAEMTILPSF